MKSSVIILPITFWASGNLPRVLFAFDGMPIYNAFNNLREGKRSRSLCKDITSCQIRDTNTPGIATFKNGRLNTQPIKGG
jgi:hypothetical protein